MNGIFSLKKDSAILVVHDIRVEIKLISVC